MGVLIPMPHVGGAHTACSPAPPGDCAVKVVPSTVATVLLLLRIVTGAFGVTAPSSSTMSAWTTFVSARFMVTASVGTPAGSPFTCSSMWTGMQVLKKTAGAVVEPTLATTPVIPGARAVANPFASTEATLAADASQVKLPIWLVISVLLWNAWATNWCVCAIEKQDCVTGSILTEVIDGCTATVTGPLVTPAAVAVMMAVPLMGFPAASEPLQTTKAESQIPAQTLPWGEMDAMLVLVELKVKVALTVLLSEFTADALIPTTCPATMERTAGAILTWATVVFVFFDPPQPGINETNRIMRAIPAKSGQRGFLPCILRST